MCARKPHILFSLIQYIKKTIIYVYAYSHKEVFCMDTNALQDLVNKYCTKEFCTVFMQEMHNIYGLAVTDFMFDAAWDVESMSGTDVAFSVTCEATNNDDFFKQYYNLSWEESDDFAVMLMDKLVQHGLVLPTSETDEIARQLGLSSGDIVVCFDCFGIKRKQDVRLRIDVEMEMSDYICPRCYNGKPSEDLQMDEEEIINHYFPDKKHEIVRCIECERFYWKFNTHNDRCNHCIIHADNYDGAHMYNNVYYMAAHDAKERYIERLGLSTDMYYDPDNTSE